MRYKKILLTCFDNLGDLVFTSSLTANLQKQYPDSEIHLWCKDYTVSIASLIPGVSKIYASDPYWDKSPVGPKGLFSKFISRFWQVKKEEYDLAIVTGACWRSSLFVWLAGISKRVGYDRKKSRVFLSDTVPVYSKDKLVVGELLRLLDPIYQGQHQNHYSLNQPEGDVEELKGRDFIVLHPFAGCKKRCADIGLWHNLACELKNQGYDIIWTGTENELESISLKFNYDKSEFISSYFSTNSLQSLAILMKHASAFIGHDSGPLHVASAMGIRTLGLYLPSEYQRTLPQGVGPSKWIIKNNPRDLSLEEVLFSLESLLI